MVGEHKGWNNDQNTKILVQILIEYFLLTNDPDPNKVQLNKYI